MSAKLRGAKELKDVLVLIGDDGRCTLADNPFGDGWKDSFKRRFAQEADASSP